MTQATFGNVIGYSRHAVIAWESGKTPAPSDILDRVAAKGYTLPKVHRTSDAVKYYRAARIITSTHATCLDMTRRALAEHGLPDITHDDAIQLAAEFPDILKQN